MRWKLHVRFAERAGETDQQEHWHCAPARLNHMLESGVGAISGSSR
jgi:hypothetical protein